MEDKIDALNSLPEDLSRHIVMKYTEPTIADKLKDILKTKTINREYIDKHKAFVKEVERQCIEAMNIGKCEIICSDFYEYGHVDKYYVIELLKNEGLCAYIVYSNSGYRDIYVTWYHLID